MNKFFVLFLIGIFAMISLTISDFGIVWDEPYYFCVAYSHAQWLELLKTSFFSGQYFYPFSYSVITNYWQRSHEHPSFSYFISATFWHLFHKKLGDVRSFRLAGSFFFALLGATLFAFGTEIYGLKAGFISAMSLLLLPHCFGHSQLMCLDLPMTCMWFVTCYTFYKGINSLKWIILSGILFGLALSTKINAFFIPIPLFFWLLIYHRKEWLKFFLFFCLIGLLTFFLAWPWLWYESISRLKDYLAFHKKHFYFPTYYFGKAWFPRPPWHYPFVLLLFTLPPVTLLFTLLGLVKKSIPQLKIKLLFIFNLLTPLLLSAQPKVPVYDGTRLFLSSFPFLVFFTGIGFNMVVEKCSHFFNLKSQKLWFFGISIFLIFNFLPVVNIYPYEFSYYNCFIGGVYGAYKKGMEITYWNEPVTSATMINFLNTLPDKEIKILLHCGNKWPLVFLQERGKLRKDIVFLDKGTEWDYLLLNCRRGFFSEQDWAIYNKKQPVFGVKWQNVPLALLYSKEELKK